MLSIQRDSLYGLIRYSDWYDGFINKYLGKISNLDGFGNQTELKPRISNLKKYQNHTTLVSLK